ncbi:hypothetical protein [Aeromicrobium sp. Leaf350]|uniref:hypothetical protein n=1 Tax=Aeromicrobium sp. Leaf350 TaxID=2876565 RepID=UPI001E30D809|nr:hypothetical protein [Aeromicrobium sp. Leaf350]
MQRPTPLPAHLAHRAFHRREAIEAGLTDRMLDHPRFVRMHPCVFRLASTTLDRTGLLAAACLALPQDAVVSHTTRLEIAGVHAGERLLHFTIGRELHLTYDGVMLHRTVKLPPTDASGVTIPAAWVQSASILPPIRAVAVADRLLASGLATREAIEAVAARDPWRPGAELVEHLMPWIDPAAASIPESQTRTIIRAACLEAPEVNARIMDGPDLLAIGDLVFRRWRLIVEYEGRQHAMDPQQFAWDIERYRRLREAGWNYLRITARDLANPRRLVRLVHRALVAQGYDGPPPEFGVVWEWLFRAPRLRVPSSAR